METPEEFLKHYHNNLPNDWLYEKREVVARLITEYTEKALIIRDIVDKSENLVCPNCEGEDFSGKGTTEVLPCLSCFGSGEKTC